jgi:hypothetical protein
LKKFWLKQNIIFKHNKMKKNVRNALAISGLALAIGASGLTLTASAHAPRNGGALHFEKHQNPSKITRLKKIDRGEKTTWHRRAIPGIVSSVSADSLVIKRGDKIFTVNVSGETRISNRYWKTIALSDIKEGDKVKISGAIADTTVTAKTIRAISLPTPSAD